jgi:hypothetical protein
MTSSLDRRTPREVARWARAAVEVFGQGKSFRDNPILGSPTLNRFGLHVSRVVMAELLTQARWRQLSWMMPRELREAFHRDGYVAIPGFLPERDYQALRAEVRGYAGPAREMLQGDTATVRLLLDRAALARLPACRALVESRRYQRLLRYAAGRNHPPLVYVQQIRNGYRSEQRPDPQKYLHSDTFHPTMKAWLFLDDVPEDRGPFTYVPGSHRPTRARLRWEYEKSLSAGTGGDTYSAKGSLRIAEEELPALDLPPPRRLAVRGNTLVIANTHGFHARGESAAPSTRLEIWAYARPNPFLPLAYLGGFPGAARLEHAVLRAWLRREDDRAERLRRARPTWAKIESASFGD